jgi:hypothetical protein
LETCGAQDLSRLDDYGGGWFGHNANFEGDSVIVRFSPARKVALAITARQRGAAYTILASIFARLPAANGALPALFSEPPLERSLTPAVRDVFFPEPPEWTILPYA